MLLFQMTLNTFGALDILPFTGVTFPFVSRGGSSLISCWGILAFIKAADTRQNASFAIKLPKGIRKAAKQPVLENEQQNDNEYVENYGNLNDFESFGSLEVFDDNYDDYED